MARFDEKLPEDFVFLAYYDQINLSVAEVAAYLIIPMNFKMFPEFLELFFLFQTKVFLLPDDLKPKDRMSKNWPLQVRAN